MKKALLALSLALFAAAPLRAAAKFDMAAAEALLKKSDCFSCHQVKVKVVGPSFKEIAKKYKGKKGSVELLAKKVQVGGSGAWGPIAMAAHPGINDADAKAMVQWVLAQK